MPQGPSAAEGDDAGSGVSYLPMHRKHGSKRSLVGRCAVLKRRRFSGIHARRRAALARAPEARRALQGTTTKKHPSRMSFNRTWGYGPFRTKGVTLSGHFVSQRGRGGMHDASKAGLQTL